ncbi:KDO2-lipid IV(A) lauroyltransferase [Humitalea rosea]|uniref:KDO2-lipid IV(A) lauroyltransferase n=1 Tax=Humitalea rosea TaxID=990373 RepID=A0A2W7HWG3_9PROT|nr:lipid A biosynthesis lauroyl acyltransferase [Humitalea rosea]PZW38996.1 KDO2-lipid IV(A) lauroyltransferase [Humitalea rosea]
MALSLRQRLVLLRVTEPLVAGVVRAGFGLLRLLGPKLAPRIGAAVARTVGPLTKAHRIAAENIRLAFPERDPAWQAEVARQAWDNLGRTACEYVHLAALWDLDVARPEAGRIYCDAATAARFTELAEDGRGALIFAAHLANWELPAVAAHGAGLAAAVLYRTPNNKRVAGDILALRGPMMGRLIPAGLLAPSRLARALAEGLHVGMLVDQRFGRGPRVMFLGREASANPLLGNLARRFDVPVHGTRAIRQPDGRIRLELTEAIPMPRDATGAVDVAAATQAVNTVIEGWVREHPGQWLWMHRRWR